MNLFSKGTVIAGAAWALFACGGGSSSAPAESTAPAAEPAAGAAGDQGDQQPAAEAGGAMADNVKCSGINECKGKSSCSAAEHACKGQNECKGKGWVEASADDCSAKGGTVAQ